MVYWSHLSVQKRFNLESGFSTFLCSEFTIRRYALFLIIYAWIRLVPARRSRPVFLILGPKSLVPLTKGSLFLFSVHVWSRPGLPMPRISLVILVDEEQTRGPLGAAFRGKLSSCMVTGLVTHTSFF